MGTDDEAFLNKIWNHWKTFDLLLTALQLQLMTTSNCTSPTVHKTCITEYLPRAISLSTRFKFMLICIADAISQKKRTLHFDMQFQPAAPLAILCLWFLNILNTLRAQWVPSNSRGSCRGNVDAKSLCLDQTYTHKP